MKTKVISAAFSEAEEQVLKDAAQVAGKPHTVAMREAALSWAKKKLAQAGQCAECGRAHPRVRAG